jgi:uncharacterized paraquat-inducible protein A
MSDRAFVMLVACHDCHEVHRVLELPDGGTAVCACCGGVLVHHRAEGIEQGHPDTILSGVKTLISAGM